MCNCLRYEQNEDPDIWIIKIYLRFYYQTQRVYFIAYSEFIIASVASTIPVVFVCWDFCSLLYPVIYFLINYLFKKWTQHYNTKRWMTMNVRGKKHLYSITVKVKSLLIMLMTQGKKLWSKRLGLSRNINVWHLYVNTNCRKYFLTQVWGILPQGCWCPVVLRHRRPRSTPDPNHTEPNSDPAHMPQRQLLPNLQSLLQRKKCVLFIMFVHCCYFVIMLLFITPVFTTME